MRTIPCIAATLLAFLFTTVHLKAADAASEETVISLERAALDRWGRGDPGGFLETYASQITYFDVATERRLDGHAALTDYYRPFTGRINVRSYQMLDPKVQRHGEVALLTYNLSSETVQPDGNFVTVNWNSTSVYARSGGEWKIIHSHWSLTAPPCLRGIV